MIIGHPLRGLLGTVAIACNTGGPLPLAAGTAPTATDRHDMPARATAGHDTAQLGPDTRRVVTFSPQFKRQELANMRNHLESLQLITRYLAADNYQAASDVASQRLTRNGMSAHDRHQSARYMPEEMLAMGAAMHREAGHFATVAQDAAVSGDMAATLRALAKVEARCVACHSTYRMR